MARPKSQAPMSLRDYARRRGVSPMAVSRAVTAGRLTKSVVRDAKGDPKIADADLADREWEATTDYSRAPGTVKERAAAERLDGAHGTVAGRKSAARPRPAVVDDGMPEELSLAEESAKEKHWKARIAELEFRERSGELVDAKAMEAKLADMFTTVRTKLLGLPTRAKQQLPHLTASDVTLLDSLVREALEGLAVDLEGEADEEDGTDG